MKVLTILVPCFNEEHNLPRLYERLNAVLLSNADKVRAEVILLDNCSEDGTEGVSKNICLANANWKYVRYSRNFGYHNSLACGFDLATDDALIVLAGDLQDPPELISLMIERWENGNDVVYGILKKRNDDSALKTIGAKIFYRLIHRMSDTPLPPNATDFRLISRRVIDVVKKMKEPDRYLRGLIQWTGFKQTSFDYDRSKREFGKSSVGVWHSLKWAVNAIICFSALPLRLISLFGLAVMLLSGLAAIYFLIVRFFPLTTSPPPTGTTSIILILLFGIGLNSFFLGVIGEYVGRVYNQGKHRPLYVIDEKFNFD